MSQDASSVADEVAKLLRAGLAEAAGGYRKAFEPFVREFAPYVAELGMRAEMGDRAAKISLRHLREQALTHQHMAAIRAQGVGERQFSMVIGIVARVLLAGSL